MERPELHTDPAIHRYRSVALLLISLLIANPVVLLLLTKSLLVSIAIPVSVAIILESSDLYARSRLVTVYLVNFFAVLSIFMHAEVIFRTNFPDHVIEELYTMEDGYSFNKPNLQKRFVDDEYAADYRTNCQGYRIGQGQDPKKKLDTADWLFIGDSFTQGAQVDFEELYTTRLYRRFPHRIVVNVGISGAGIVEEYSYYRNTGSHLGASTVFLQICSFNDFMRVQPSRGSLTDYLVYHSDFLRFLLQGLKYQNPADLPLRRWTEPFYPDVRSNRDYNVFYVDESAVKKADLETFIRYLRTFADEARNNRARLVTILIPTKEQVQLRCFQDVITSFGIRPDQLDMLRPNKFLKQQTDELGIQLIDMLQPFRQAPEDVFFEHDEHLTATGHEILAAEIAKAINEAGTSTLLSSDFSGDRYPTYSSDGKEILYQSPRDGNMELFSADPEFRQPKRLTHSRIPEFHPVMSNDGSLLAFTEGDPDTFETRVRIATVATPNNRTTFTEGDDLFGAIPSFSPDDQLLAYAEWRRVEPHRFTNPQIVVVRIADRLKRIITTSERESWRPVFSPDGSQLAYIAKYDGQFDLFLYDLSSGCAKRITSTPFDEWDPQFSPDGRFLVYSARLDGNWDLFVFDRTAYKTVRLTRTKGDEWDASFSPSGDRLIYAGRFGLLEGIYQIPFVRPD